MFDKSVAATFTTSVTNRQPMKLEDPPDYYCYNNLEEDLHVETTLKCSVDILLTTFAPEGGLCTELGSNRLSGDHFALGFGDDESGDFELKLRAYDDEWM